ncbi:MAG: ExbD/TolR family protein [Elusimicrobiota bacterium]
MNSSENSRPITDINVTPLVDVVLVLLIIFMATAPLIQRRALNVNVPRTAHSEKTATATLQIQLAADRTIVLEEKILPLTALAGELSRRFALEPGLHVSIAADQAVPYGEVVALLDVVRGLGIKKAALEVRPGKK